MKPLQPTAEFDPDHEIIWVKWHRPFSSDPRDQMEGPHDFGLRIAQARHFSASLHDAVTEALRHIGVTA